MTEETDTGRVREILKEVRPLAAEYYRLTGKPLGVTGEVAEYVAAELLNLELAPARTEGYDAVRQTEAGAERIQIKGRAYGASANPGQRLGTIKQNAACDTVMLVLLDNAKLEPKEIWEAPYPVIAARLAEPGSKSRDRGALGVAEFKRLGRQVWGEVRQPPPRLPRQITHSGLVSPEARQRWAEEVKDGPFNLWLRPQVTNKEGRFVLEQLYEVARQWGIQRRYDHLNEGLQRMQIGSQLRRAVPKHVYDG